MASYVINSIDTVKGVADITVTLDGGIEYHKRMMVPVESRQGVLDTINAWLAQYIKDTAAQPKPARDLDAIVNVQVNR